MTDTLRGGADLFADARTREAIAQASEPRAFPAAPSDAESDRAWEEIMKLATEHCLVVEAFGGAARLAVPSLQREAGIRDRVLKTHCRSEAG